MVNQGVSGAGYVLPASIRYRKRGDCMNLEKLFEAQKELSQKIVETKGLQGKDLLDEKILALQVELGELANEWRGFKFWSEEQKPRIEHTCSWCIGAAELSINDFDGELIDIPCFICEEIESDTNPLLEEYVDCLHFILDIGNTIGTDYFVYDEQVQGETAERSITKQFQSVFGYVFLIAEDNYCSELLNTFLVLGEMLGFTWEQIEQAYYRKNKINHARQENGY